MNRMGMPSEEEGGGAQTRVSVLAELPLLEARLDAPSLRSTDSEQTQVHTLTIISKVFSTLSCSFLHCPGLTSAFA